MTIRTVVWVNGALDPGPEPAEKLWSYPVDGYCFENTCKWAFS